MTMSRSFTGIDGNMDGHMMMPFLDLLNGRWVEPTAAWFARWVDRARGEWVVEVVARRDLQPGEEVPDEGGYMGIYLHRVAELLHTVGARLTTVGIPVGGQE